MADDEPTTSAVVTAAEIARLAGVTRAAVSNWRRRYGDFPRPADGTATSPLFSLSEVQQWLDQQGKGQETSTEVDLWRDLRAQFGDDPLAPLAAVAAHLLRATSGDAGPDVRPLTDPSATAVATLSAERGPAALLSDLVERTIASTTRSGGEPMTTTRLARAVAAFATARSASAPRSVYDPACGIGTLLLAVGPSDADRSGQEIHSEKAVLAQTRSRLDGLPAVVTCGDSLREDLLPGLQADLVVCDPPVGTADWGRDALLLDPRWELGVPPRAESELAWVQHCYAHTAPGGRALLVLPTSVAYRRAGRRIRAELVRRGQLDSVVALPAGLMANHSQPVHLWILGRPRVGDDDRTHTRMVDLTTVAPDDLEADFGRLVDGRSTDVPAIDILDDDVDLSPGRYVTADHADYPLEYAELRNQIRRLAQDLLDLLPELPAGPGRLEAAPISLGDLVRGELVDIDGTLPTSRTDQLDSDYLRGFLRSAANTRRNTTASGGFRLDVRSAQLPQMDLTRQQEYGAAFRRLAAFEDRLREAADAGARAGALAFDGLTRGALLPPNSSESQEAQGL